MPKILPIIIDPDRILRKKSISLSVGQIKSSEIQELISDMTLTMLKKDGVGLAAPQIGKNINIVIINTSDGQITLINPVIIKKSWTKEWGPEGCLSIPNTFGQVRRHKKILYTYLDKNGIKVKKTAKGLLARIVQHETDHLAGILFIDKAKEIKKQ